MINWFPIIIIIIIRVCFMGHSDIHPPYLSPVAFLRSQGVFSKLQFQIDRLTDWLIFMMLHYKTIWPQFQERLLFIMHYTEIKKRACKLGKQGGLACAYKYQNVRWKFCSWWTIVLQMVGAMQNDLFVWWWALGIHLIIIFLLRV